MPSRASRHHCIRASRSAVLSVFHFSAAAAVDTTKAALDEAQAALAAEEAELKAARAETVAGVPADHVATYERVRAQFHGIGVTRLVAGAVERRGAQADSMRVLTCREPQPSRGSAMLWRRSSAMAGFLMRLAAEFRRLPPGLLAAGTPETPKARASQAKRA